MKWNLLAAGVAAILVSCCVGCQTQDYSKALVDKPEWNLAANILLSTDDARKGGHISDSRIIETPDHERLEVWIIKARDAQNNAVPAKASVLILHSLKDSKGWPYLGAGERLA